MVEIFMCSVVLVFSIFVCSLFFLRCYSYDILITTKLTTDLEKEKKKTS